MMLLRMVYSGTILKNDHDGFVTPMKLNNKRLKGLKIDDVMDALASPACTADNNKSIDMEALYKKVPHLLTP